jgi:hypothetical protein
VRTSEVDIINNDVIGFAALVNPLISIGDVNGALEIIKVHVLACKIDAWSIDINGCECDIGQKSAQRAKGCAASETEHEDRVWRASRTKQAGGDHVIPSEAGEKALAMPPSMHGLLHAEFYLMSGFPNLDALVGRLGAFNAVHDSSSLDAGRIEKKKGRKKAPFGREWCLRKKISSAAVTR